MKKHLLVALILIAVAPISFCQNITDRHQTPIDTPSNIERYKIDYELVDESLIATDNSILNSIDLSRLEFVRHETEDILFFDKTLNIELRVYSVQKATQRKRNSTSPNQLKH